MIHNHEVPSSILGPATKKTTLSGGLFLLLMIMNQRSQVLSPKGHDYFLSHYVRTIIAVAIFGTPFEKKIVKFCVYEKFSLFLHSK